MWIATASAGCRNYAWWSSLQLLPVTLRLLGFFPDNDAPALVYILAGVAFVQGVGATMLESVTDSVRDELQGQQKQSTRSSMLCRGFPFGSGCANDACGHVLPITP